MEEGEHSAPIFINITLYKTSATAATKIQPLLFWPLHAHLLQQLPLLLLFLRETVLQGFCGYWSPLRSCNQSLQLIKQGTHVVPKNVSRSQVDLKNVLWYCWFQTFHPFLQSYILWQHFGLCFSGSLQNIFHKQGFLKCQCRCIGQKKATLPCIIMSIAISMASTKSVIASVVSLAAGCINSSKLWCWTLQSSHTKETKINHLPALL